MVINGNIVKRCRDYPRGVGWKFVTTRSAKCPIWDKEIVQPIRNNGIIDMLWQGC